MRVGDVGHKPALVKSDKDSNGQLTNVSCADSGLKLNSYQTNYQHGSVSGNVKVVSTSQKLPDPASLCSGPDSKGNVCIDPESVFEITSTPHIGIPDCKFTIICELDSQSRSKPKFSFNKSKSVSEQNNNSGSSIEPTTSKPNHKVSTIVNIESPSSSSDKSEDPVLAGSCNSSNAVPVENKVRELIFKDTRGLTLSIPLEVNSEPVDGVIDTAAQLTLISESFLSSMKFPLQGTETVKLKNAQENSSMIGRILSNVSLTVGSNTYKWNIIVAPIEDHCILGLDFLKVMKCNLDLDHNTLGIGNELIPIFVKQELPYSVCRVTMSKHLVIQPHSVAVTEVKLSKPTAVDLVFQPSNNLNGLLIPASIIRGDPVSSLYLVNQLDHCITLKPDRYLGNAVELDCVLRTDTDSDPE